LGPWNFGAAGVPLDNKQAFIAALVRSHGTRLRRFLELRLRSDSPNVPDLVQDVYLRLLRMPRHETIRSPQAYLFTVARNVLHEHLLSRSSLPKTVEMDEVLAAIESYVQDDPAAYTDACQQLDRLDQALSGVSPRAYATFVLHRRYGYTLEEIAVQLGVSRPTVKKYLAKAVQHCRQYFAEG
jgi:RNA polymerase sigma factor (sigma-70 family)